MKKTVFTIVTTAAITASVVLGTMHIVGSGTHAKAAQTIETEKVTIEYFEIENGDFDVIITPKDAYNVAPVFSLDDTKYYGDTYITGRTETSARKLYEKVKEDYPEKVYWAFSWNN